MGRSGGGRPVVGGTGDGWRYRCIDLLIIIEEHIHIDGCIPVVAGTRNERRHGLATRRMGSTLP